MAKVQKKTKPLRPLEQKPVQQQEQGTVQMVSPQVAYQRTQVGGIAVTPTDLLALQRTLGNQWVQRQFTQEPRSLNQSLDPSALTKSEIYQEIQLIRQWLHANVGSSSEKDRLIAVMQRLENQVWQGEKKRKLTQAPQPKDSKQITALDYDIFSLPNGQLKSGEAGLTLIRNWEQVEQVYLDAASGNPRAQRFVKDVEEVLSFAGKGAAEKAYSLECTLPIMKEFSKCIPNWSFFDFLRKDKPGALRLRQVIAAAYEKRSQELGIRNEIIGHAVNLLLAGIVAKGALTAAAGAEIKEGLTLSESLGVGGKGKTTATEVAGEEKALTEEGKASSQEVTGEAKSIESKLPAKDATKKVEREITPQGARILGASGATSKTVKLYHYGNLEGVESFKSPPSYPRLTDCDIATSQAEAASYTGTPITKNLRYKYELEIDRGYFEKNFENTGTRKGYSEYGTKQPIPVEYFRKISTLK